MIRYDPARPMSQPAAGEQIGLRRLYEYLFQMYGGSFNGIFADRPMRGSTSPSVHRDGRALDWKQPDKATRQRAFDWLIKNAVPLQIQRIHFYSDGLSWHCDGSGIHVVSRSISTSSGWWQSWADWLHIERNWNGALDSRPIADIVGVQNPLAAVKAAVEKIVSDIKRDTLNVGEHRPAEVAYVSALLAALGFHFGSQPPGVYNESMREAVRVFQKRNGITPHGAVGDDTIDALRFKVKREQSRAKAAGQ